MHMRDTCHSDICHITFTVHVCDLTFITGGLGSGGGATGKSAAKPETAARDCISAFVRVKPSALCA